MQLNCEIGDDLKSKIYTTIQSERINRYKAASKDSSASSIQYYAWNCEISEAFYISLQFAEIVCRNTIHSALQFKKNDTWPFDSTFVGILNEHYKSVLSSAIDEEMRQHGSAISVHHIVSALPFGFWEHLTTKRFKRYLWPRGFQRNFPNAPASAKLDDLHSLIERVRRWRNRIAHHRAIFDKGPTRLHQDAITLIEWRCKDTARWVQSASRVPQVINQRPE